MTEIENLDAQITKKKLEVEKLDIIIEELKGGVLASLWLDEAPSAGILRFLPIVNVVLEIIIIIIAAMLMARG